MSDVKVPFIDLKQRYEEEKDELEACVKRILSSGHFVLTPEVTRFEEAVAGYTGARHCIGLNSGTDALMMGLMALGIGRGDEVITSPISFVASTGAIAHVGATPVYADVGDDQNIDPAEIEKRITPHCKAIMPVHWGGRMSDMAAILVIAARHGLAVLEDSAQSMGAWMNGRHGGTFGFAGAFSAHPLKNFNALGDGGFLLTDDDEAAKKVRLYRNHGLEDRDTCVLYGVNSRLDSLHAEVLLFRLTRLESIVSRRRHNADLYRRLIRAPQVFIPDDPADPGGRANSYVMMIVQCENRDGLRDFLRQNGIEALVYYGTALHLHPAAQRYGYKRGDFPKAEAQADKVLALPHHQHLTEEQISYVADCVNRFYAA